jgi:hypothetical protein
MSSWGKLDSKQISANVRVTNGSFAVSNATGNATIFLNEVKPGDYFVFGPVQGNSTVKYYVANVLSNVLLNLTTTYAGSTASGKVLSILMWLKTSEEMRILFKRFTVLTLTKLATL